MPNSFSPCDLRRFGNRSRHSYLPHFRGILFLYRISGAFFFDTAASVASVLDKLAERPKTLILDFSQGPLLDSTAAATLDGFARKAARAVVYVTGVTKPARRARITHGIRPPRVRFRTDITAAIAFARRHLNTPSARLKRLSPEKRCGSVRLDSAPKRDLRRSDSRSCAPKCDLPIRPLPIIFWKRSGCGPRLVPAAWRDPCLSRPKPRLIPRP